METEFVFGIAGEISKYIVNHITVVVLLIVKEIGNRLGTS
jgi:hypothetical protein